MQRPDEGRWGWFARQGFAPACVAVNPFPRSHRVDLFRTKALTNDPHVDAGEPASAQPEAGTLKRALTARQLVLLGIGAVIGAGIFVMTGQAAANHAGPAITLSFVIA